MTDRNELERLLAAATEGPWEYRPDEFDDWGVVKSPPREVGDYEPPFILRAVLAQMRDDRRLDEEALNEHRRAGTDPWEANARLVVFLRNNAPHYLSLMDEVKRLKTENEAAGRNVAQLQRDGVKFCEALHKCADLVRRYNGRQTEKLDDIPAIVAQALGETHDN